MHVEAVTMFGGDNSGRRMSAFEHDGLRVTVTPADAEDNERAFEGACKLSRAHVALVELEAKAEAQAAEIARLKAKLPGAPRARLLGRGCVRFRDGWIYLLNRRDEGWASFALQLESWDEFFRRWDVAVVEYGTDQHGAWWEVENTKIAKLERPT